MTEVFLDTSFLLALVWPHDELHVRAVMWHYVSPAPFIISEFVLLEIADGLAARGLMATAVEVIEGLRRGPRTEIVPASAEWIARGYDLFKQRQDKSWSLTDCISFEIMRERGIT